MIFNKTNTNPSLKLILILCFVFTSINIGRCSFSEWNQKTRFGNNIYNYGGYTIQILTKNETIDSIHRWYFYKDHIIGEQQDLKSYQKKYFILNEKDGEIKRFKKKRNWDIYIKKNHLEPRIWTRWIDDDWDIFYKGFWLNYLIQFKITIPLTFIFLLILYKAFQKERFRLFKPFTTISLGIIIILILNILMSKFPQSI